MCFGGSVDVPAGDIFREQRGTRPGIAGREGDRNQHDENDKPVIACHGYGSVVMHVVENKKAPDRDESQNGATLTNYRHALRKRGVDAWIRTTSKSRFNRNLEIFGRPV